MAIKHTLALVVLFMAFAVWVPGIYLPMLTLKGEVDKAELVELGKEVVAANTGSLPFVRDMTNRLFDALNVEGQLQAYEKTRSILGTVGELFDSGNFVVGFLIMLFSVLVPVAKGLTLLIGSCMREIRVRGHAIHLSNLISKWSMADVFVVAIIVAYLAANATQDMGEIFTLHARFEAGFYYFLGYCVLSILSAQLMSTRDASQMGIRAMDPKKGSDPFLTPNRPDHLPRRIE